MDLTSDHPFWPLKDGLLGVYPTLKEDLTCDVVVLGGGISGALVTERLSREGLNVVVLDKRDVGAGSTSASTALLQYEIDTSLVELTERFGLQDAQRAYRLCYDSLDAIAALIDELKIKCDFQKRKSVYLATRESETGDLRAEYAARQAIGIEIEYWEEKAIAEKFSFSRPGALVSEKAAQLDCYRFAHELFHRATQNGARIFDRTTVTSHDTQVLGVLLQTDKGYKIHASHAVFATGYEAQEFLPRPIVNLKSTYALASEPLSDFPGWWQQCQIWETARPYLYFRTTLDKRILVGGRDDSFRNPNRRDMLVHKRTEQLAQSFSEMFPAINLEIAYRWAGTFGETKDGLPYIGEIPEMPRCHFALGFGGNGITYSHIAADVIRDAILKRPNPFAYLFRFDR